MQRHPALQPLSRDHHDILVMARSLGKSLSGTAADRQSSLTQFVTLWEQELRNHLDLEDQWLMPHLPHDLRGQMTTDHNRIRELSTIAVEFRLTGDAAPREFIAELANVLRNHVRWEERKVFESLQVSLSLETLAELSLITAPLDVARRSRLG